MKNNRPSSVLPKLSKIFERLIENQIKLYTNIVINPLRCRFRESHSKQHALLQLFENCKKALKWKMNTGAIFIDLFKVFDCLNRDLLLVKLEA